MSQNLSQDWSNIEEILAAVQQDAAHFLAGSSLRAAGASISPVELNELPEKGIGAQLTRQRFWQQYDDGLSGGTGPRYFGFVTGGVTPAALAGDWLASTIDQNAFGSSESNSSYVELSAIKMLHQLFGLSQDHLGTFVTGATMSNFVSLAIARQWLGHQHGVDIARQGLQAAPPIRVFSGSPHASIFKAMSMLGLGRENLTQVATLPNREAIDVAALEQALKDWGKPAIVVANVGTVNTVDFDNLPALLSLREEHSFFLHADGAFGGFAACSEKYNHLTAGLDMADTITIDAHKYLNVPYDSAMQFSRHERLQAEVFANSAVYLGNQATGTSLINLTPENSRRLRALPAWFSLMAYGREGYRHIVEHSSNLAATLGEWIAASDYFYLLAPVRLNGICFGFSQLEANGDMVAEYLGRLQADGRIFLTPTNLFGQAAIRVSITNWRTGFADIELTLQTLIEVYESWQNDSES